MHKVDGHCDHLSIFKTTSINVLHRPWHPQRADRFELYGFHSAPDAELSTCLTMFNTEPDMAWFWGIQYVYDICL